MKIEKTYYTNLLQVGTPIIIGQLGTLVLGVADTLMVGHYSTNALAAASFVNAIFNLLLIVSMGFSFGLTPVSGSLYGKEAYGEIGQKVKSALVANLMVAALLMLVAVALLFNLHNMGQPEEIVPLMGPYLLVNLLSIPFQAVFNTLKQFADSITNTSLPMWVMITGNLINIGGNALLIYGLLGCPELGLLGAGISSALSRVYMAAAISLTILFSKRYKAYREGFHKGSVTMADQRLFFSLGIPVALQQGMEAAAFSLSGIMVGWLGTLQLAAHQITLTVSQLFYMVYLGLSAAVSVRVSYFKGQNDIHGLEATARAGFHITLIVAVCASVPILLIRNYLGGWFTDSEAVSALVALNVFPLIVYQIGDGLQCVYANAERGIGDVKPLIYIAFLCYFVVCLPLGYVFGFIFHWGLVGIWCAFPFGLTLSGLLYHYYFQKNVRKMKGLTPPSPTGEGVRTAE